MKTTITITTTGPNGVPSDMVIDAGETAQKHVLRAAILPSTSPRCCVPASFSR